MMNAILTVRLEIRNRIYTFASYPTTGEKCCVAPCVALVRTCKQIYHEYRPVCRKADVIIDWRDVPRYFHTYFTDHDGIFTPNELAPARMVVITNASLWKGKPVNIDLLPILKLRLANENFKCEFIRSGDEESKGCGCVLNAAEVTGNDLKTLLAADVTTLQKLLMHQDEGWVKDVHEGRIHKLVASHIGTNCCPTVRFHIGPGEQQSVPAEFVTIAKDKGKALVAAESRPLQVAASHWILAFSTTFDAYMDRIKLQSAFTDNQYSFYAEFKWSLGQTVRKERVKSAVATCGPEKDSESGVSVD